MISLPQHFLGPPGVVQMPIETDSEVGASEADSFATLMEPPAQLANDSVAMLLIPPQLSRPQPVTPPLAADPRLVVDAPVEPDLLNPVLSDAVEIISVDVPQAPFGAVPTKLDIAAPLAQPAEPQDRMPPETPASKSPASLVDGIVESAKGPVVKVELGPAVGQANVGENAFLTRLEAKAESFTPTQAVPSVAAKTTHPETPNVTLGVSVATAPAPKVSVTQIIKQDQIFAEWSQTTETLDRVALPAPISATVAKTALPALGAISPDIPALPDPQIIILSGADRPPAAPQIVPGPLPASIPATLLAQAPEAALGPVEIVLDPKELGKIRFEIHQQGDQLKVVLAVERPETLDLLRRHADQLIQEFRAAGFAGASLGFGHWGGQHGSTSSQAAVLGPDSQTNAPSMPMRQPSPNRNFGPQQGLNLRL